MQKPKKERNIAAQGSNLAAGSVTRNHDEELEETSDLDYQIMVFEQFCNWADQDWDRALEVTGHAFEQYCVVHPTLANEGFMAFTKIARVISFLQANNQMMSTLLSEKQARVNKRSKRNGRNSQQH